MQQTILFTVIPRAITLSGGDTLPVSVFVSPRLFDGRRLGDFPDWLNWTELLKENGLHLTFSCDGHALTRAIDPAPLRPDVWRALFNEGSLVRSHTFDDYSDHTVFSYPVRFTLSALKFAYQNAAIALALPERSEIDEREKGESRRNILRSFVNGLDVHWDEDLGEQWRNSFRDEKPSLTAQNVAGLGRFPEQDLSSDGLVLPKYMPPPGSDAVRDFNRAVVKPFAVYHHMPQPKKGTALKDEPPDMDNILDFHQALTSLNNYPELQRALGLVFDFDLPRKFIGQTPLLAPKTIAVRKAKADWDWRIDPKIPRLSTAYLNAKVDAKRTFFLTAPRGLADKTPIEAMGLLNLDPTRFGLAQVDVDGAMHKTIILAETLSADSKLQPVAAPHPEVFDPTATLPALRSGGFSLYADVRAAKLLERFEKSKIFDEALTQNQSADHIFYYEDLVRGYRLDVWDSHTKEWHSLHLRNARYFIGAGDGQILFEALKSEGFVQLAATKSSAKSNGAPAPNDLYLHEAIARWAGWSLGAPMPGKHLARSGDPTKAVASDDPNDPDFDEENPTTTPFKLKPEYRVFPGSLPSLRFGRSYRFRARVVDLAGNSFAIDDNLAAQLAMVLALPRDAEGFPYLRYEPVISPLVVMRDARAVTGAGSAIDRLVIRTFNTDPSLDNSPADLTASDRHIVPPRATLEMGERLGMFDDAAGKLITAPAMYDLLKARDEGELQKPPAPIMVHGKAQDFPLEPNEQIDSLPFLPDPLARGAAFRDLPGTPSATLAIVGPGGGADGGVAYETLVDANPRPGSATLVNFGGEGDWQKIIPFRFALGDGNAPPRWNPSDRLLTVFLPKGTTSVVPLSSYIASEALKLMGVWQWLREYIEHITITAPQQESLAPGFDVDEIAHILQRCVEGGHWMLTPPRLLTLVHAVQQPIGTPAFTRLLVQRASNDDPWVTPLQSELETDPTRTVELATITSWRKPDSVEAYLLGGLQVHGASTAKIDLHARWEDPVDDPNESEPGTVQHSAHADEIPIATLRENYLRESGRLVGYYTPEQDLIAFVRRGDAFGSLSEGTQIYYDAAPRHHFNDTKHHRVTYTAVATSRYREYFGDDPALDFTRTSAPIIVDVPASARPAAPRVLYVIPTFGWQRQTGTNVKRSVRFGGGLRIYLERPWHSSGVGELLGVTIWNYANGQPSDDALQKWKPFITQWGADPIWRTASLGAVPQNDNFPEAVAEEYSLSLEESTPKATDGKPGRVHVAGFPVHYDKDRKLWYCDLTINTYSASYMPFVRLALVRYQPHALADAKLSRVVLADFAQLTPDRSVVVTTNPYHPRQLRVVISGPAPHASDPEEKVLTPTRITVTVQQRDPAISNELTWRDAPANVAAINIEARGPAKSQPDLYLWNGTVNFVQTPKPGQYRLLIREYEYIAIHGTGRSRRQPQGQRLIYAETVEIDATLAQ